MVLELKYYWDYIANVALLEEELWETKNKVLEYIDNLNNLLCNPSYHILIYLKDDKVVGFVKYIIRHGYNEKYSEEPVIHIDGLFVSKNYRNQDIATELMKEVENDAREMNIKKIVSCYSSNNTNSTKLHDKLGFNEYGKIIQVIKELD